MTARIAGSALAAGLRRRDARPGTRRRTGRAGPVRLEAQSARDASTHRWLGFGVNGFTSHHRSRSPRPPRGSSKLRRRRPPPRTNGPCVARARVSSSTTPRSTRPTGAADPDSGNPRNETFDATLFAGVRPGAAAELWVKPETDQGFDLSNTFGIASFTGQDQTKWEEQF